jgi:hypothetical protein
MIIISLCQPINFLCVSQNVTFEEFMAGTVLPQVEHSLNHIIDTFII